MKVYKTEPDKYGWYLVIHKKNDGSIKIYHKQIDGKYKQNWTDISIWRKEELKLLKKVLNEKGAEKRGEKKELNTNPWADEEIRAIDDFPN